MVSVSDVRVKRKISSQLYIYHWFSIISGHGANPVFFNKKIKTRHSENPPPSPTTHPLRQIAAHLCLSPVILPQIELHMRVTPYV